MPSYSNVQFGNDWVYAIAKDFKSPDEETAQWAAGQPAHHGNEQYKIPLSSSPTAASVNADGTLMALGQEHDIHIYTIKDLSLLRVLKGHVSRVDAIEFHPKKPTTLISCAMSRYGGSVKADPAIIFWDLDKGQTLLDEAMTKDLSARAVSGVADGLKQSNSTWILSQSEREALGQDVEKSITTLNIRSQVREGAEIRGRLASSFGSHAFNHNGTSMIYLPGLSPRSNAVDDWKICIWDTGKHEIKHTLKGHTDALMWIGFSPDDKLIASVSWDKTFRIWNHADGHLLHIFKSNSQNWTGGFSPDSRFFAGTSGEGRLWVWDVVHGVEVTTHAWSESYGWCRSLAWSPDGKRLVIGGWRMGPVFVYDIKSQSVVQERLLSADKCPEEHQSMMGVYLEVSSAQYLDGGHKIVYRTSGDNSVEVYDFEENKKWRFAPEQIKSTYGPGLLVLENKGLIASVDADAVRFWKIPLSLECQS